MKQVLRRSKRLLVQAASNRKRSLCSNTKQPSNKKQLSGSGSGSGNNRVPAQKSNAGTPSHNEYFGNEVELHTSLKKSCWGTSDESMKEYHDNIWGRPEVNVNALFESMCLQLMQCGVQWKLVWNKRNHFRRAFSNYDVRKVAQFTDKDVENLMNWPEKTIIRNRRKLDAVVWNAKLIVAMEDQERGSFASMLWKYAPINDRERLKSINSITGTHMRSEKIDQKTYGDRVDSDGVHPTVSVVALSDELRKCHGFKFMGPTVVISWMQAIGLLNHHGHDCHVFERNEQEMRSLRRWLDDGKVAIDWKREGTD